VLFGKYLEDLNAKWVLASRDSETDAQWLFPYIASHAHHFVPVWKNEDFTVYRIQMQSSAVTPADKDRAASEQTVP
jgi:hypothetical protein